MAVQGNKVKVFEGNLIKEFDVEIAVIEKKLNSEGISPPNPKGMGIRDARFT